MVCMLWLSVIDHRLESWWGLSVIDHRLESWWDLSVIDHRLESWWGLSVIDHRLESWWDLSVIDHRLESWWGQTKDYEIDISCFSAKHAALRKKCKYWLARNKDNMSYVEISQNL
jgi:hypothetical protein